MVDQDPKNYSVVPAWDDQLKVFPLKVFPLKVFPWMVDQLKVSLS